LLFLVLAARSSFAEDAELKSLFDNQGIVGTMIISSQNSDQTFVHNTPRSRRGFAAASTFKILNTLIALEEKVISSSNDKIEWDGHIYGLPAWNRHQTLDSAFRVSCVWCYQKFAQSIGVEKYKNYLSKSSYGALQKPFELTEFWLDGSLLISAVEQIEFLKKVHLRLLPFTDHSFDTLKEVMLIEQTAEHSLWAKGGWATSVDPQVGWYVGIIETNDEAWYFASNIEVRNSSDLVLRQQLVREALRVKNILN